jgi:predicted phage terminase large subunit-like protein
MATHQVLLHKNGPALWPEHKPLAEVLELRDSTPDLVWSATYQGRPVAPGGYSFKREWWQSRSRFDLGAHRDVVARYLSADTAMKAKETSDYFGCVIGELTADYRLFVTWAVAEKFEFPDLLAYITTIATEQNWDGRLRGVIIEDKASGTSALQTLQRSADEWLKPLLIPFVPTTDKQTRYQQASVWCKNGCVWLPHKDHDLLWLADFEDQLFSVPQSAHDDMADAFAQMILYLELLLEDGYLTRKE